jgi:hypothetical protein
MLKKETIMFFNPYYKPLANPDGSLANSAYSASSPMDEFKKLLNEKLTDQNTREKIVNLFERIFGGHIVKFENDIRLTPNRVSLELNMPIRMLTNEENVLCIPQKIAFNILNNKIHFYDEDGKQGKNCPYEDCTNSWLDKEGYYWCEIWVEEKLFWLVSPLHSAYGFIDFGKSSNLKRRWDAEEFTNSLHDAPPRHW